MQGSYFPLTVHFSGTMAADATGYLTVPFNAQLVAVQAGASNAHNKSEVKLGTTTDDDAYLVAKETGKSKAFALWRRGDFVGGQNIHFAAGSVIEFTVTKGATTAAQNVTLILWFTEG